MFKVFTILVFIFATFSGIFSSPATGEKIENFIVGGTNATAGQFPHTVSLRTIANVHFCGGFIINRRWVGTTALCIFGRTLDNTLSVVGTLLLRGIGMQHRTCWFRTHQQYDRETLANNIGLVNTCTNIAFNDNVQPINLGVDFVGGGVVASVSGWGQTANPGSHAESLQFLDVPTLTNSDCRSRHSTDDAARIFDDNICTFLQVGAGTCISDSGSPLTNGDSAIAVVSWSVPCAQGYPDVYTRISSHREWITNILDQGPW